ncbi:hypothetical protein P152DRAFT_53787 [Eremomyces bilateralis CBS 781.70]|uniref:Uncharacterized protein n=1 Tax=Eremomyces bilateralis CBS 781.70 TaxID=1392243 RepID=A0A6G1G0S6_9PEZI|nr:uncharacterized protein P152DRAFT_53787 [Eremomyces bilateralis CBS 781.70]KAF1811409.1 hypothetical protein P152DRAFT_53787 [Eremomyces bilateralis CBS 781.70]
MSILPSFSISLSLFTYIQLPAGAARYTIAELKAKQRSPAEVFAQFKEARSAIWAQSRNRQAAEFLDVFVRQNEMDLRRVDCYEVIMPIYLHADHKAHYFSNSSGLPGTAQGLADAWMYAIDHIAPAMDSAGSGAGRSDDQSSGEFEDAGGSNIVANASTNIAKSAMTSPGHGKKSTDMSSSAFEGNQEKLMALCLWLASFHPG